MTYIRKKLYLLAICMMLLGICYCKTEENKAKQVDKTTQIKDVNPKPEQLKPPADFNVGEYSEIPVDCKEALQAYSFLQSELSHSHPEINLLSIEKAMFQVVAGYNVILCCMYTTGGNNKPALLYVKVYTDPEEKMHLEKISK